MGSQILNWGFNFFQVLSFFNATPEVITIVPKVADANISYDINTDFKDRDNWAMFNFDVVSEDPVTVELKDGSRGNIATYNKTLSSSYTASLDFVPMTNRAANVVIQYDGLYQLIIGENNLKAFSLELNTIYEVPGKWEKMPDEERGRTQRFIGGDGFLVDSKVKVSIFSTPLDNHNLRLEVVVNYSPTQNNLGGIEQNAKFVYVLPTPINAHSLTGQLGVGMIDPAKIGDLRIQLLRLKAKDLSL